MAEYPQQARQAWRRVVRGGSFDNSPENLRSANRDNDHPENRNENLGFRCVRVPPTCRYEQRHAAPVGACVPHPGLPVPVAWRPSGQATIGCCNAHENPARR